MKKNKKKKGAGKTRERGSRASLTIILALFVLIILLSAIALTALGLYIMSVTGVLSDAGGQLDIGTVILFMMIISLVIGAALAFIFSRIPLKPINLLINKMNRLASGDFGARLQFGSVLSANPAIKEISDSFNTMACELENTEMLRRDFINNFSHEFKTPIVSISGFAKLLSRADLSEEQRNMYLRAIDEEAVRLSSMATNVLNLSKIENQTILTDVSRFNLSEQIRAAILLLCDKWEKKNIEMIPDFDEYEIEGCEELLKEVWINLIDNAIKFSPEGACVSLFITQNEKNTIVTVENTGITIPREKLDKIFGRFYQGDSSHAEKGNGIGLAIVKRIVELHRGEVSVSSEDEVTSFTVTLPKKA